MEFKKWLEATTVKPPPTIRGGPGTTPLSTDPYHQNLHTRAINAFWQAGLKHLDDRMGVQGGGGGDDLTQKISNITNSMQPGETLRICIQQGRCFPIDAPPQPIVTNEEDAVRKAFMSVLEELEKDSNYRELATALQKCKKIEKFIYKKTRNYKDIEIRFVFPYDPKEIVC